MSEHPIKDLMGVSMEKIKEMVDVNTIIGTPIQSPDGTVIIPISKVSMGFATGGLDYIGKGEQSPNAKPQNFGAGGGTGLSIQPLGFLTINAAGEVEMINIGVKNPSDPIEQIADIIERSPEIIAKVKALLGKDKED